MEKSFENDPLKVSMRKYEVYTSYGLRTHMIIFFLRAAVFQYLVCKTVLVFNSYAMNKIQWTAMRLLEKLEKLFNLSDV